MKALPCNVLADGELSQNNAASFSLLREVADSDAASLVRVLTACLTWATAFAGDHALLSLRCCLAERQVLALTHDMTSHSESVMRNGCLVSCVC